MITFGEGKKRVQDQTRPQHLHFSISWRRQRKGNVWRKLFNWFSSHISYFPAMPFTLYENHLLSYCPLWKMALCWCVKESTTTPLMLGFCNFVEHVTRYKVGASWHTHPQSWATQGLKNFGHKTLPVCLSQCDNKGDILVLNLTSRPFCPGCRRLLQSENVAYLQFLSILSNFCWKGVCVFCLFLNNI